MFRKRVQIFTTKDRLRLSVIFVLTAGLLLFSDYLVDLRPKVDETEVVKRQVSIPVLLSIPKINLETTFGTPLGLAKDGAVEVPDSYEEVGWYKHSPLPGKVGPAVILGHVDSVSGPAIFYSIGLLQSGDEIFIHDDQGGVSVFEVVNSKKYEQKEFPTELVYGDIDYSGLRLVTCSGWYNKATNRYSHNRIVFARLKNK